MDAVCVQLFNGDCELYKGFGLVRVSSVRYVDGDGSPGAVALNLSRFGTDEGAYAFFTHRIVGDSDPAQLTTKYLRAPGAAAIGAGIAYSWRGRYVAELTYTNELEAPEPMKASAAKLLPMFVVSVASRLRGATLPPSVVGLLPKDERLALGVRLDFRDALGIAGAGRGALGFYSRRGLQYSLFVASHVDEDSAKDVERTLRRQPGGRVLKDMPFGAFELVQAETGARSEWLFGRQGPRIVGVGSDRASASQDSTDERPLSRAEKITLIRQVMRAKER